MTMEEVPMYKMPTIDLTPRSLLKLSQLGFFVCFTYWSSQGSFEENIDYAFPLLMAASGLALFLSVPNSRIVVALGIPVVLAVMGLAMGEDEAIFWAVFMLFMFGPIAYLPEMASGDPTLDLDDETRIQRLGIIWLFFALIMLFGMSSMYQMATDGEWIDEDFDEVEYDMSIDSTHQTIAQIGMAVGVFGVLVFILTAMAGMELGAMLPWYGGAMTAGALLIGQYLWIVADGGPAFDFMEVPFILSVTGLISLPPCIAYADKGGNSTIEEE